MSLLRRTPLRQDRRPVRPNGDGELRPVRRLPISKVRRLDVAPRRAGDAAARSGGHFCHRDYDQRKLDLTPHLTGRHVAEVLHAVEHYDGDLTSDLEPSAGAALGAGANTMKEGERMSGLVVSWVLRNSDERRANRAVLLVLAEHAKRDGSDAWPSVATIASEAGVSSRSVQYALRALEARGAIRRAGTSRWRTAIYAVVMDEGATTAGAQPVQGATTAGAQSTTPEGATTAPKPSRTVLTAAAARASGTENASVSPQVEAVQAIFERHGPPGCRIDRESVENAAARFPTVDLEQAARGCAEWLRHHRRKAAGLTFHRWLERETLKLDSAPPNHRERGHRALKTLMGQPA